MGRCHCTETSVFLNGGIAVQKTTSSRFAASRLGPLSETFKTRRFLNNSGVLFENERFLDGYAFAKAGFEGPRP
jgi:hypothetical protein